MLRVGAVSAAGTIVSMRLLEREAEFAALEGALAGAALGRGSVVLVSGEAGIGKTCLVAEFATRHRTDARILWGACDALATPRALGPFSDIGHEVGGPLEAALASGGAEVRSALVDLFATPKRPTVMVVEDAHWADVATLDGIKFIGRRIGRLRGMLIVTHRDDPDTVGSIRATVGDLPATSVVRLPLRPLTPVAVAELASGSAQSPEHVYALTGGNPFLVAEALDSAGEVPLSVRDAIAARTSVLSARALDVVELVSVVPRSAERWLLEGCLGDDVAPLDEACESGLLEVRDSRVRFRHELVRRAVEDGLAVSRRRSLNQMVLGVLESRGEDVARIVHHASAAEDVTALLRFAPMAARRAAEVASHREAEAHYRSVVPYLHRLGEADRAPILSGYSEESYYNGHLAEAISVGHMALDLWRRLGDVAAEGRQLRWLSRYHWWQGESAHAVAMGEAAIAVLEKLPTGHDLAMAYSNQAQLAMLAHNSEVASEWATKAIAAARDIGDQDVLAHALNNLGSARLRSGDPTGTELLRESLAICIEGGLDEHACRAYVNLAWTGIDDRRYGDAARDIEDGMALARTRDLEGHLYYLTAERAMLRFDTGDWPGAESDARWALSRPEVSGIPKMPALVVLARLQVRRGDPEAVTSLDEAWRLASPTRELQRIGPVALARAELAWLGDDIAGVGRAMSDVAALGVAIHEPWVFDELAFWRWRGGAPAVPFPGSTTAFALHMTGNPRGAAAEWGRLGCGYEQADALADTGDTECMLEALTRFDRLGAVPAAARVRRRLRDRGVTGIPRGPRRQTRTQPGGLTARQFEVLRLLEEGLTNSEIARRLFVSPRTVDHHVTAVLTRLGASDRKEAVAAARDRGYLGES